MYVGLNQIEPAAPKKPFRCPKFHLLETRRPSTKPDLGLLEGGLPKRVFGVEVRGMMVLGLSGTRTPKACEVRACGALVVCLGCLGIELSTSLWVF